MLKSFNIQHIVIWKLNCVYKIRLALMRKGFTKILLQLDVYNVGLKRYLSMFFQISTSVRTAIYGIRLAVRYLYTWTTAMLKHVTRMKIQMTRRATCAFRPKTARIPLHTFLRKEEKRTTKKEKRKSQQQIDIAQMAIPCKTVSTSLYCVCYVREWKFRPSSF